MTQKRAKSVQFGFDARGLPRLEECNTEGQYRPVLRDTDQTRRLKADDLRLAETQRNPVLKDSYAELSRTSKLLKHRSRLDYMRALSEAIRQGRQVKGFPKEHSTRLRNLIRKLRGS